MPEQPKPEWAAFFSESQFEYFLERLEAALGRLNKAFVLNVQEGSCRLVDPQHGNLYGIINLAQVVNQSPMDDWDSVIDSFLAQMTRPVAMDELPTSFDEAAPLLRIRMFVTEGIDPAILVKLPLTDDFATSLVLDLPDKVLTVTHERAEGYGVPLEELFDLAKRNVVQNTTAQKEVVPVGEGSEVISYGGPDFFVSSLSLSLDELIGDAPPLGRLVAVPNRHHTLALNITDGKSLAGMGLMVHAARGMFRDGPGSISPYVYWVRNGTWRRLSADITEQGLGVEGPEIFVDEVLRPLLG